MKVYKYEILDGLTASVQSQASIAYCSPAVLSTTDDCKLGRDIVKKIKASSSNQKQIDLYYIKSVLVSTGWNKNDDVFSNEATWAARNTPEDKQFNFMHNENDIIGHITGSYVVDRNGNAIANDISTAPAEFDIITEAVLYNSWTNPENRERMNTIIAEIEAGKWFVSMECLFAGFDYALISPDGNHKVIARNDDSSFLTKHLRAYGGTGEYEGYKIGRSLRDISFSGKGLVSKPANPRSVILDASKAFSKNENSSSILTQGEKDMSDQNIVEQQPEVVATATEVSSETQTVETNVSELQQSLSSTEQANKVLTEAVAEKEKTIEGLKDAIAAKDAELNAIKAEMDMMKKKEKMAMRKASLVQAGFDEAEAEQSLELYDSLEDSAFEAIVAVYKKKMAKMAPKVEFKENITKDEENESTNPKAQVVASEVTTEVTDELFDGVKSTEATLVDASGDEDELNSTRASVAQWLTENVFSK